MKLHKIIKDARLKAGKTQQQLADDVGMSTTQISRFELGKSGLYSKELRRIDGSFGNRFGLPKNVGLGNERHIKDSKDK